MNTKKQENTHNRYMQIRLTQEEYDAIERKFRNSGLKSRSDFIRTMIFEGHIFHLNETELQGIYRLVSTIANNVNQIAVRVNSTGKIYAENITQIQEGINQIWQQLFLRTVKIIQKNKPSKTLIKRFQELVIII